MTCIHVVPEPAGRLRRNLVVGSEKENIMSQQHSTLNINPHLTQFDAAAHQAHSAAQRRVETSEENAARQAWFPKNPGRRRVRGLTVIRAPRPRRTFPTFSPPLHLLPRAHTALPGNCSAIRATTSVQPPPGDGSVIWRPKETAAVQVEHHASSIAPRNGWGPLAMR